MVAAAVVVGVVAVATLSRGLWSATPARSRARTAIAVVPFKNLTGVADSELIVDGLTYELIRNLSVIDGLEVRSATSAFALKGGNRQLADIGRELKVDLVLEGAVIESGGEWRVQAQLSRVGADTPLWTGKFDRNQQPMFAVVDDISLSVVNQLRLALGKGQRRYNLSDELSMLYLKARALVEQRSTKSAEAAVPILEELIARDPTFAPAYAGLSDAYAFMSQSLPDVLGLPHEQALVHMRAAATRAIELDPLLAEAHAAMGFLHSRELSWDDADRSFRRAIELNPSLTHVYTSYSLTTLVPMGRFAEDRKLLTEVLRRDPLSLPAQREMALLQLTSGDYADAIRILEKMRPVTPPAVAPMMSVTDLLLGRALALAGRLDESLAIWEPVKGEIGFQHWTALAFVRAGRREETERMAAAEKHPYRLALFHAALGNKDRALEELAKAAEVAPHRTVRLLVYPELASLRSDPRFQAIRARFNLR
jgi:TolB-like protein/Tfp pilus assembly protein PilF